MKSLCSLLIALSGFPLSAQAPKSAEPKPFCLDSVVEVEANGVRSYTLIGSCRVVVPRPTSLLSDKDSDLLNRMRSQTASITPLKTVIGNGGDVKLGAIIAAADEGFRKNRKELCSRHPEMSVFDLNAASDEILAHPCTDKESL
jgi:hypothetical protein